jgi:AGCS family alanine or glycine:cation symporter
MDIFASDGWLTMAITSVNDFIWTYILIILLVGCGLYFTWRTRFVQLRMVGEMVRLIAEPSVKTGPKKHISAFQAFAVSVATRVGTGNLAGVATAIAMGGPGAVFWMWMIALIGGATAFIESTLAQLYKRHGDDSYKGGPAYYIKYGLGRKWMAALFAVLITLTFGLSYNSVQSNTICSAMHQAFGWNEIVVGAIISVVSLVIAFGGIQRIARVSAVIVPLMAVGYFILALVIVLMNYQLVPHVFKVIVTEAFGLGQFTGGLLGMTVMYGIKRGLFSNEAGEGSAPNVAATASVSHPVKQGLVQALGVFTDTFLVCSCTAFIILISGVYSSGANGIALTQEAMQSQIGHWGKVFIAIAIFFFAFSSIIGNYYYGETNIQFLTRKRWALVVFRLFSGGVMVMLGALASLNFVWSLGDICMAMLTACNLAAIIPLSKYAFKLLKNYQDQKRNGIASPNFKRDMLPDLKGDIQCWD